MFICALALAGGGGESRPVRRPRGVACPLAVADGGDGASTSTKGRGRTPPGNGYYGGLHSFESTWRGPFGGLGYPNQLAAQGPVVLRSQGVGA